MIKFDYLYPIISSITNSKILIKGRAVGRTLGMIGICANALPMLEWDFSKNLCFNPKKIPKVADRKKRKACYQAFVLYKKSFKPTPKIKIWKDASLVMNRAFRAYSDHITDAFAFFAQKYNERAKFAAQYECRWDLSK